MNSAAGNWYVVTAQFALVLHAAVAAAELAALLATTSIDWRQMLDLPAVKHTVSLLVHGWIAAPIACC